jgi:SAM-dependent methyltransferase
VFDIARHQSVAEGLARYIMKFSNKEDLGILEVGAASFRTALFLKKIKPSYVISALEQYPEQIPATKDISVILDDFFDFQPQEKFDVCYSNQVMEHFDDPIQFLRQSSKVIRDEGLIIVCCPTSTKTSNELLFSDHISHFTETAMKECALNANLEVIDSDICDWDSLTHIYAMTKKAAATSAVTRATSNFEGLLENRTRLLDAWLNEDSRMCEILRDVDSIVIYGAGEFTQLIRAYLPKVWTKVKKLVVDNLEGIRAFDRPVYHIDEITANDRNGYYLIGAHKQSRSIIMKKLLERKIKEENIFSLEV